MTRGHRGSLLLRCRTFPCPFSKPVYPGAPQTLRHPSAAADEQGPAIRSIDQQTFSSRGRRHHTVKPRNSWPTETAQSSRPESAPPRSLAPCHQRPGPGLRQAHRSSVLDLLSVVGHRDVQSAPRPVLPAGASPGSAVLPGTTWLPPAAWVTFTRRAWALGDAGMVTCRTPSA